MKSDLPRYIETRSGELPDAYLVDGGRLTPLSRIADVAGGERLPVHALPAWRRGDGGLR